MASKQNTAGKSDINMNGILKKERVLKFSSANVHRLLVRYLEKKNVFQSTANSPDIIKAQKKEWKSIALALNAQTPLLKCTWREVRQKYEELEFEAKKLNTRRRAHVALAEGENVDLDTPFYARFIIQHILHDVNVDGMRDGLKSDTPGMATTSKVDDDLIEVEQEILQDAKEDEDTGRLV